MTTKRLTQQQFIDRCVEIHGDQLLFDKTVYVNTRSNVVVTCPTHGDYQVNARSLLSGVGCRKCNLKWAAYVNRQRLTTDEFKSKASNKHNGYYTYDRTEYVNSRTPVIITCPVHGDFEQGAGSHLEGYGCPKCGDLKHGDYRPWYISTYFDRFPEKKTVPATLYLLYSKEESFYKVGITTKDDLNDRVRYMANYSFEIVDYVGDIMYNVALAEQDILNNSTQYHPTKKFGGHSECIKEYVDIRKYLPEKGRQPYMEEKRT